MVTAFVGSTIPFRYIAQNAGRLKIETVVCSADRLATTYARALRDLPIRIVSPGQGRWHQVAVLVRELRSVDTAIFFHECGWPMLDLLYMLVRPHVQYVTQVSLSGRERVSPWSVPRSERLRAVLLSPWFDMYRTPLDGGGGYYHVPALRRKYGLSADALLRANANIGAQIEAQVPDHPSDPNRAIVIVSRDFIPDNYVTEALLPVLSLLEKLGYSVDIKDHPNPDVRLNLTYPGAESLDAALPVEMVLPQYGVVVGIASTALAETSASQQRVVSVLRLLPAQFAAELALRMAHLVPLARHVVFPADLDELELILAR